MLTNHHKGPVYTFQWNLNQTTMTVVHEIAYKNTVYKIVAICFDLGALRYGWRWYSHRFPILSRVIFVRITITSTVLIKKHIIQQKMVWHEYAADKWIYIYIYVYTCARRYRISTFCDILISLVLLLYYRYAFNTRFIHIKTSNGNTTGLILGLRPANERRRYFVATSLIGWVQT